MRILGTKVWTTSRAAGFRKAELTESTDDLRNPGRGWYHIYTLAAEPPTKGVPLDQEIWFYDGGFDEKLALVLIDLSAFRTGAISSAALKRIDSILEFFRLAGKQVILRFTYDTRGSCVLTEPATLSGVKLHMQQIGPLVQKHSPSILVCQGLFVGNWGEMHGSRFSDIVSLSELAETFSEATADSCYMAMRTPALIRALARKNSSLSIRLNRVALFNDGMFASETDLGTYGTLRYLDADDTAKWARSEELQWQSRHLSTAPNGGEAAAAEALVGFSEAVDEMRLAHTAYLNSAYHENQLVRWRSENVSTGSVWDGMSGYDYIGRHLGYRFTVRDVFLRRGKQLFIAIENSGFGNLCQEADCFLNLEPSNGQPIRYKLPTDPRTWESGKRTVLATGLCLKDVQGGQLRMTLALRANSTPIILANRGAGSGLKIGELTNP